MDAARAVLVVAMSRRGHGSFGEAARGKEGGEGVLPIRRDQHRGYDPRRIEVGALEKPCGKRGPRGVPLKATSRGAKICAASWPGACQI